MRLTVFIGILIFSSGLYIGSMVGNRGSADDLALRYQDISLQSGLKLAFSSYLRACTEVLDAAHTPGDQYQSCLHLAHDYMEDNVFSILRQKP